MTLLRIDRSDVANMTLAVACVLLISLLALVVQGCDAGDRPATAPPAAKPRFEIAVVARRGYGPTYEIVEVRDAKLGSVARFLHVNGGDGRAVAPVFTERPK